MKEARARLEEAISSDMPATVTKQQTNNSVSQRINNEGTFGQTERAYKLEKIFENVNFQVTSQQLSSKFGLIELLGTSQVKVNEGEKKRLLGAGKVFKAQDHVGGNWVMVSTFTVQGGPEFVDLAKGGIRRSTSSQIKS